MMRFVPLYYALEKPLIKAIRIGVFLGIVAWVVLVYTQGNSLKLPVILLSVSLMLEVFIRFKLSQLYPIHKVSADPKNMHDTATMPVLASYHATSPADFIAFLTDQTEIQFMMERMHIQEKELPIVSIPNDDIFTKAMEYAKTTHTNYIDTPHIFGAYLVLAEQHPARQGSSPQASAGGSKLLFQKKLKETDVLRMIVWTSLEHPKRQQDTNYFQIIGEGYGEALVRGWTYETSKHTLDWTAEALQNEPKMFGVTDILHQMVGILSQPQHNNVLLIGPAGSGKHMLIDKLAFESYNGHVPRNLQHKRVLALITSSLLAGMNETGELETRLQLILAELSHAEVILAIPEIQDILGSGTYNMDLSGTLLPYLEHGNVPIIATTTTENYKKYVEHSALRDVFTPITLKEPDKETLYGMLFMAVIALERRQQLRFSYLSVVKAAELAHHFDTTGVLPGSAVKLLEATGTALLLKGNSFVTEEDVASHVETTTHIPVSEPNASEKQLLMNLEQILHGRVIGQEAAISAISQGMRRLREGLASSKKPISFLFLGPTGVGKTETAKALADIYFQGQTNILRFDMSEYSGGDGLKRLLGAAPGEGEEKGELTEKVFDHPSSLILLDEFEKAHPAILDLFLQVLDDGRLTDNKGKTVSFSNCIIIATSNAGSEYIRQHIQKGQTVDKPFHQQLLNHLQTNHLFKPELLNRFDEVVVFKPLDQTQVITITTMLLQTLVDKLRAQDIEISFDPSVIQKIAAESFDPTLGARPIHRYIQSTLEDIIAKKKLEGVLVRGSRATFVLDPQGSITLQAL